MLNGEVIWNSFYERVLYSAEQIKLYYSLKGNFNQDNEDSINSNEEKISFFDFKISKRQSRWFYVAKAIFIFITFITNLLVIEFDNLQDSGIVIFSNRWSCRTFFEIPRSDWSKATINNSRKFKLTFLNHFWSNSLSGRKMVSVEEVSFASEWNDLKGLRQLSETSKLQTLTTAAAKKNSSNSEEAEAIAKAGNVRTVPFVEQRSVLL